MTEKLRYFDRLVAELKADEKVNQEAYARYTDRYNKDKCWHVYRTPCRHYTLVQTVEQQVTGVAKRIGKEFIQAVLDREV